jgi:dolichyl-phosphate-mannose--protein O-mannosyl transferase
MPETSKVLRTSLFFFIAGFAIFSWQFQYPWTLNFDEFHYIPAAQSFLKLEGFRNLEHPPLAKMLIAVGIGIFGNNPYGWRIMSVFFGALTLSGMYLWALQLFKREEIAVWTGFLTLANFFLFVQSRIAMLDTFMFAFLAFAGWAFTAAWDFRLPVKQVRKYLALTGLFLGLGMACKWFSLIQWVGLIGLYLGYHVLNRFNIRLWPAPWKGLRKGEWMIWLIALPTFVYFLTFIPFLFATNPAFSFGQIFTMQKGMWDLQKRVVTPHPYMSQWYTWAIMKRPIWYAFDKSTSTQETVRGVFLVGNPLIMLTGLLALVYCFWDWIKQRRKESLFIIYFYFLYYGSWALIPRVVSFYYYYYPAAMILSFALALVVENRPAWIRWSFLTVCMGIFIFFYPILAAVQIPTSTFVKWMWLRSWI